MVTFSKFYRDHVQWKTCQQLMTHTDSCTSHCLRDVPLYALSNFKYFAPICFIPVLMKLHHMDKHKLQNALKYYVECSLVMASTGWSINFCMCLFRNLLGQFGYYTFLYLPAMIGSCMLHLGSPRTIELGATSLFQCNIESFLLMRRNVVSRLLADSRLLQTYVFMLCSALILQGKQIYNLKGFWLLPPNPKQSNNENRERNKCDLHTGETCNIYLLQGMGKYFALGLTLDMIKALMSKVDVTKNQSKVLAKFKNFRIRSTALLTAYMGIYRFTHCYLNRHVDHAQSLNHFTSAFLAGFCYYFYPQSNLFSYALLQAIRTLWSILKIENANSKHAVLQFLFSIPFLKILFPFALANSVHLACLRPQYSSSLTNTIVNGATNNYPNHIKNQILALQQKVSQMQE